MRRLTAGEFPAGTQGVKWDGADGAGRQVASGVYQVRLVTSQEGHEVIQARAITLVE